MFEGLPGYGMVANGMDAQNPQEGLLSPKNLGLLGLIAGLSKASGPSRLPQSFGQVASEGLLGGVQGYQQGQQMDLMNQFHSSQLTEMQRKTKEAQDHRAYLDQYALQLPASERPAFLASPETFIKEKVSGYNLKPGEGRFVGGNQVASLPALPSLVQMPVSGQPGVTQGTWLRPGETSGPNVGAQKLPEILNPAVQAAKVDVAKAGAPQINVSSEKKYAEQFAGKIADDDVSLRNSAQKAPDLAERANRIKETLATGKVIAGAGADYRLALGKALNLVGASDQETIANTETLSTSMAQNTLDAIKASGLGSGSGFSNADRDFLEKAVGGKITLEASTIDRLATLAHRAAEKTAERWSTRAKQIPKSAIEGTGISTDPVMVPKIYSGKGAPSVLKLSPEAQQYLDEARKAGNR